MSTVQPYLFSQIGLDSGSLTMLGAVVHQFADPGEYRGVSLRDNQRDAVFYLTVEKGSPINQVNIDLYSLSQAQPPASPGTPASPPSYCGTPSHRGPSFVVGAKGHVVFHVSGGPGGFAVHVGRSAEEPQPREFDSIELKGNDLFAATLLRPGVYAVHNVAKGAPAARAELDVAYPPLTKAPYQPPPAIRIECTRHGFHPDKARLQAMQGCLFVCQAASRVKIELIRPHEPPAGSGR